MKSFEDAVTEHFDKGKNVRGYYLDALRYVENEAWQASMPSTSHSIEQEKDDDDAR